MRFADVSSTTNTAEDLERAERELLYGFDIVDPNDGAPPEAASDPTNSGTRDRFASAIPISEQPNETDAANHGVGNAPTESASKPSVRARKSNLKLED